VGNYTDLGILSGTTFVLPEERGTAGVDIRGGATLLGVVATDLKLSKVELTKLAQIAQDGIARAICPAHTMHDGDTVFALSAGSLELPGARANLVSLIGSTLLMSSPAP
jgi:L-aminopeptidase/D-esterase-like protein